MAAFCACCGAEIKLKGEACAGCGAPQHGMIPAEWVSPSCPQEKASASQELEQKKVKLIDEGCS